MAASTFRIEFELHRQQQRPRAIASVYFPVHFISDAHQLWPVSDFKAALPELVGGYRFFFFFVFFSCLNSYFPRLLLLLLLLTLLVSSFGSLIFFSSILVLTSYSVFELFPLYTVLRFTFFSLPPFNK